MIILFTYHVLRYLHGLLGVLMFINQPYSKSFDKRVTWLVHFGWLLVICRNMNGFYYDDDICSIPGINGGLLCYGHFQRITVSGQIVYVVRLFPDWKHQNTSTRHLFKLKRIGSYYPKLYLFITRNTPIPRGAFTYRFIWMNFRWNIFHNLLSIHV